MMAAMLGMATDTRRELGSCLSSPSLVSRPERLAQRVARDLQAFTQGGLRQALAGRRFAILSLLRRICSLTRSVQVLRCIGREIMACEEAGWRAGMERPECSEPARGGRVRRAIRGRVFPTDSPAY